MAFSQKERTDKDGLYLTKPEVDHVRRLVVAELEAQGHIEHRKAGDRKTQDRVKNDSTKQRTCSTLEGEDLSDYMPSDENDILF